MSSASRQPKSGEVRRLLRSAADPIAYDLEAGLQRHQRLVAERAPLPDWADQPTSVAHPWRWLRVLGGLGVLMVGLGYLLSSSATPSETTRRDELPGPASLGQPAASEPVAPAVVVGAPTQPPAASLSPTPSTSSQPASAVLPARTEVAATLALPRAQPVRSTRPARVRATRQVQPPAHAEPAPVDAAGDVVAQLAASSPQISESRAPAEAPNVQAAQVEQPEVQVEQPEVLAEMEQLRLAEQLLPRKPERTLALVRLGFQRFRPGYLNQERRYLEVMALLGMGKVDDARLLGGQFLRDYPAGPYRRKVESALAR